MGVCYKRGFGLYLYYSMVGTELSVSCTQVVLVFHAKGEHQRPPGGAGGLP